MADREIVIDLKNVSKMYKLFGSKTERMKEALHPFKKRYHKDFYALNGISLQVRKGEILGIVGMNGCGKSTLLKIIAGIIQPTGGSVSTKGTIVPLLELGNGFNPDFTGLENVYFYNSILGFSRKQTEAIIGKILDFAEIGDFIHQPLKSYSSGMKARLAFAVSVNIDPDILIVDEVLAVGDELFRRKSFAKIEEFFKAGKTILFVSHSVQNINQLCSRAVMIHNGNIILDGPSKVITMYYQKFIFSKPEHKPGILNEFKKLTPQMLAEKLVDEKQEVPVVEAVIESKPEEVSFKAYMVENFVPKSTVITRNADITATVMKIETPGGKQVNHLVKGESYLIRCRVECGEDIGRVSLGMSMKTEQGVAVTWRFFPDCNSYLPRYYHTGDHLEVQWQFTCQLIPDVYFIGIAVRREAAGGSEIVFRASDCLVFRVLGEKNFDRGGIYDPDFEIKVS